MTAVPDRRGFLDYAVEHSLLLPVGAIAALLWANTAPDAYHAFAHALEFVVNDIGMVFFFALATKEIVEATAPGGVAAYLAARRAPGRGGHRRYGRTCAHLRRVCEGVGGAGAAAGMGDSVRH